MELPAQQISFLQHKAVQVRRDVIRMLAGAGSGHPAGSLSAVDILVALYFQILKHNQRNPEWPERDRFVLSNGHICPALYAVLARAGYFSQSKLLTLRKLGSSLQGHPHRGDLPGLETTSGSLGSGLSQACGMALAAKMDRSAWRVICLMSDGEQDEGNIWEAVMFAAKCKLDNLTAVVDCNGIQIDGPTQKVMPLESLKNKYQAFGWEVLEIDGHNFSEIINAFEQAGSIKRKPTVIIAHTIPGKGVPFMENKFEWHGKSLNKEEAEKALGGLEDDR